MEYKVIKNENDYLREELKKFHEYRPITNETDYQYILENYGISTTNINKLCFQATEILQLLHVDIQSKIIDDSIYVKLNLSDVYSTEHKIVILNGTLSEFCNTGGMFPSEPFNYDNIVSDINNNINEFDITFTYKFGHFIDRLPKKLYTIDNNEIYISKPDLDNLIEIDNTDKQIKYLHNIDGKYFLKL